MMSIGMKEVSVSISKEVYKAINIKSSKIILFIVAKINRVVREDKISNLLTVRTMISVIRSEIGNFPEDLFKNILEIKLTSSIDKIIKPNESEMIFFKKGIFWIKATGASKQADRGSGFDP